MLLKRLLLFIYLFIPLSLMAQGGLLSGRVTDSLGAPLSGSIVTIPDLKTGAATDSAGYYAIENLPKGSFLVQVHMISYNTLTVSVAINGRTEKDFQLTESILERSEVVVTGTSLATEQRKSTTPITSVRLKELQENASGNIIDAISRLPGMSQVSTGPALSKPVIRGLGGNRLLVVNENIRQEGQQWGDEHGIEIDDYNVSKVEVLKGPASLAYGSDALAGVVNVISDDALHESGTMGNVSLNYQTNNGLAAGNVLVGGHRNGYSWKAYGTGKLAHDYRNRYDGYVFNSRFHNVNYGASIGLNKRWGYSRLSFTSFNQKVGIAEGDRDSATGGFVKMVNNGGAEEEVPVSDADGRSYAMQLPYQDIGHDKLVWNNGLYLVNGGRLGLTLGVQQNTRKEFEDILRPDDPGLSFLLRTLNYDLKFFFPEAKGWQLTVGLNGMSQSNQNSGIEYLIPDYKLFDIGAYTIARKELGNWSLSGGLRYDHRKMEGFALYLDSLGNRSSSLQESGQTRFGAFDRSFSNLTGSLGFSYGFGRRTTIKLNVASGYRAPNIAELSANGVHEGTVRYEYGNNNLQAEQSFQADLGLEYNSDHIYLNASLFANYVTNFVYLRKLLATDGTDSVPELGNEEGYKAFAYDQGNAVLYGGELYMDLHPHPLDWLHFDNTISYVRGFRTSDGTDSTRDLPAIPPLRWLVELRVQKRSFNDWLKNGFVKLGADINFAQEEIFSAYNTETPGAGYVLVNAGIGVDVVTPRQKTICTVTLSGQNLFDTPYQHHLSRLRYAPVNPVSGRQGVWNTGRNLSLLLSFPLHF